MKQLKGLGRVFSFTFRQQTRTAGYRSLTAVIAALCLLVPILIWTAPARRILKIYLTAAVIATVALGLLYIAGVQSLNPAFVPMMLAGIIRSLFIILPREKSKTT